MRPVAKTGAHWEVGKDFLSVGPVEREEKQMAWTADSTVLHLDWLHLMADQSIPLIEVGGAALILPAPSTITAPAFSEHWRDVLRPASFPFGKIEAPDSRITLDTPERILEADLSLLRNRAGAIEATGEVRRGNFDGSFFLRLGWDSLESGGSFEGTLSSDSDGGRPSDWIRAEPLRTFLKPFPTVRVEGSVFLDSEWRPFETVVLISADQNDPTGPESGFETFSLSGSFLSTPTGPEKTRFLFLASRPEDPAPSQLEVVIGKGHPIRVSGAHGKEPYFHLFFESWSPGSKGKLVLPDSEASEIPGIFATGAKGGMVFVSETPLPAWSRHFSFPGIFSLEDEETFARDLSME